MSLAKFWTVVLCRWRAAFLLLGWALVSVPSLAANLSGSYVGGGDQFVVFLQLVQTENGQIVGRLRQRALDPKGVISTLDTSLSGAASGDQFVGKLERSWVAGGNKAISGQISNGLLQVSSADGLRVQLQRGRESDFTDLVDTLENAGIKMRQEISAQEKRQNAERVLGDAALRIDRLTKQVAVFVLREPQKVESLSSVSQRYERVSDRMGEMLVRLRAATGQSREEIGQRSSLAASLIHASIEAEHAHIDVQHAKMSFEEAANRLLNGLNDASKACAEVVPSWIKADAFHQACALVSSSAQRQSQVSQAVHGAYEQLEKSWQKERLKQEAMLQDAKLLQRQYGQK